MTSARSEWRRPDFCGAIGQTVLVACLEAVLQFFLAEQLRDCCQRYTAVKVVTHQWATSMRGPGPLQHLMEGARFGLLARDGHQRIAGGFAGSPGPQVGRLCRLCRRHASPTRGDAPQPIFHFSPHPKFLQVPKRPAYKAVCSTGW